MSTLLSTCYCGSTNSCKTFYNDIPIIICNDCGIFRQDVDMTEEEYNNYYQNDYLTTDYTRSYDDEIEAAKKRIVAYDKFLTGKILDIGCGLGGFVSHLKENNFDCWGQDIIESSNEETIYQGELEDINFPTDHFQTVTLHDVLEHIINPVTFLKEIFRLISQEGYVIIDFPDFYADAGQKHWRKIQHLWMLNRKQLSHLVSDAGFIIIKTTEPIPGKIVIYAQKPKQNRTTILLPPGIGDIYWVLAKLESFLEVNRIDLPDIFIQEQGVKNRGLAFIEKFPFLHSAGYQQFSNGRPSEFREAYHLDQETVFKDILGCDYFLAFNGPMRYDKSLHEIHPEYKVNWYPRMFVDKEEESYGRDAVRIYGEYIIGYFSNHKMYKHWLAEFDIYSIVESLVKIHKLTGYKIILVGSSWDLNGPADAITKLAPDICINIVNETSLTQLFGLFKKSKGVIGFPSGITIMGVTFKIKTVMIWNRYFRKSFWKHACVEDSWNNWYKSVDSGDLTVDKLVDTYIGML